MFFGRDLILLAYVDDILRFGKDTEAIKKALDGFNGARLNFTEEEDVYAFLGVEVKIDQESVKITLLQKGLTDKIIIAVDMVDANIKHTHAEEVPLGSDPEEEHMIDEWSYPSVIGMLLYLCSNSRPDIQFAVHQCERFSHSPMQKHANAVKMIVRYLIGTRDKGLILTPDDQMILLCHSGSGFPPWYFLPIL